MLGWRYPFRELLYEHGFTINGARNRLDGAEIPAMTPAPVVRVERRMDTRQVKSELKSILSMLNSH